MQPQTPVRSRRLPWALGIGVFAVSFFAPDQPHLPVFFGWDLDNPARTIVVVALAAISAIAAAMAPRNMWPVVVMGVIGFLFAGMWPALCVASWCAGLRLRRPAAIAAAVVGILMVGTSSAIASVAAKWSPVEIILVTLASSALTISLPFALGRLYATRTRVIEELTNRAVQLEREKAALADKARTEERAAIAREMHDLVAHRVAIMVLHAGALELESPNSTIAERSALISENGRLALTELRQVLGILRTPTDGNPAPPPSMDDINALIEATRAAGLPVSLEHSGPSRQVPAAVQRAAHRVIREALTNVLKHAGRVPTTVTLHYLPSEIEITVANDAPAHRSPSSSDGGLGLVGLAERLKVMGGTFRTELLPRGAFQVTATIPT